MYLYLRTELDRTYLHKNIKKNNVFNKDFYEMLSNIKAYQFETASRYSHQNFVLYTGLFVYKGSLLILTSSCHICLHSHKMIWLYRLNGLKGMN